MRSILVLGLLMTFCASANAATLHHHRTRHHVVIPPGVASSFDAAPGWTSPPPPAVHYDDAPSYNDPSKRGGGAPWQGPTPPWTISGYPHPGIALLDPPIWAIVKPLRIAPVASASGRGEWDSLGSAPPYWPHGIAALLSPAFAKLLDLPKCHHNTCAKAGRDQHEKKVHIGKRAHKLESSQRARTASIGWARKMLMLKKTHSAVTTSVIALPFGKYGSWRA
jgi:hypothetical protein